MKFKDIKHGMNLVYISVYMQLTNLVIMRDTMIDRTGMTIEAYLDQMGIKSRLNGGSKTGKPPEDASPSPFDAMLRTARSTKKPDTSDSRGSMAISDYLRACKGQSTTPATSTPSSLPGNAFGGIEKKSDDLSYSPLPHHLQPALKEDQPKVRSSRDDQSGDNPIHPDIRQSIRNAATKYAISEKLIQSVIQAESSYQPDAVSPAGAQGLMQLMPATARELGVSDPFDVDQNIDGGARYLRKMMDRFGGDIKLALAAYNAGPGTVQRYNGNVPYPETQTYIQRVFSTMAALGESIG